uniref:Transmembrane protein 182 n=1 Tax=Cyclopterus lumpus TaxID=8103 RepID=A0A8C2WFK9_CYCLU
MRVGAATLAGGIFGLVGTLCFFLAFGTDYWLVASDNCGPYTWPTQSTLTKDIQLVELVSASPPPLSLLHEGFFWRCGFQVEPTAHATLATLFSMLFLNMSNYNCSGGDLFVWLAVFRGFWTVLIVLGLVAALTGGFLLVCGVPFSSHKLHTLGGAFLIAAACLFLFVLLLFVLWMEVMDVERYVLQERGEACPQAQVSVLYGLSFMVAAAGVPLELVSGMVFMLVGRALRASK